MACDIDLQLGKRLRRRRQMVGLTQQDLGAAIGLSCQQIQKYEYGSDRMSAACLWRLSAALETSVGYFYDGLNGEMAREPAHARPCENIEGAELLALVGTYTRLPDRGRRKIFSMAHALTRKVEFQPSA